MYQRESPRRPVSNAPRSTCRLPQAATSPRWDETSPERDTTLPLSATTSPPSSVEVCRSRFDRAACPLTPSAETAGADITERARAAHSPPPHIPKLPLAPAPDSRTVIDRSPFAEPVTAADTMTGVTSQDVHQGFGYPASGMTSAERQHDGEHHRKRQGHGTETYGAGQVPRE